MEYFARVDGDNVYFHKTSGDATDARKSVAFSTAGSEVHVFADSAANEKAHSKNHPT